MTEVMRKDMENDDWFLARKLFEVGQATHEDSVQEEEEESLHEEEDNGSGEEEGKESEAEGKEFEAEPEEELAIRNERHPEVKVQELNVEQIVKAKQALRILQGFTPLSLSL